VRKHFAHWYNTRAGYGNRRRIFFSLSGRPLGHGFQLIPKLKRCAVNSSWSVLTLTWWPEYSSSWISRLGFMWMDPLVDYGVMQSQSLSNTGAFPPSPHAPPTALLLTDGTKEEDSVH
jgi:hypothetical protein